MSASAISPEGFGVGRLEEYLDRIGLGGGPIDAEPIGEGHSNLTFLVSRRSTRFVLRRPPAGPLPPSAHDVVREASIIRALEGLARVPKVLSICDDADVIGAPFFLMELAEGIAVTDEVPPGLDSHESRFALGIELIDALAEIHRADWRQTTLAGLARPGSYLGRQLKRLGGLWEHNKTREVPAVGRVHAWLTENMPMNERSTLVHGDFRLGNTLVLPTSPVKLTTVLDWEMATIGDPLADLGYLCALWVEADDPSLGPFEGAAITRKPGFASRDELLARYEEKTGMEVEDLRWYRILALWKATVFMEGNYARYLTGRADDDPYLAEFDQGVPLLAQRAEELCS